MTNTKIDLGTLFRYIESLNSSDDEVKFLEEIFRFSKNLFPKKPFENFVEIDLPIDFSVFKGLALKYGFATFSVSTNTYICWKRVSLSETPFCDIAHFFRHIQRLKFSETQDSFEEFEICKEICKILSNLKREYKFQRLIPVHLSFSVERANLIAKEYGFHVTSGGSNTTYLGIADKVPVD